jgi:hypothetical protein
VAEDIDDLFGRLDLATLGGRASVERVRLAALVA